MNNLTSQWWAWVFVGYLCGSIPFAFLLGRVGGVDIRKVGSGNVGATNLARALGKHWGWACFTLDALKGCLPALLAGYALGHLGTAPTPLSAWCWLAVGVSAVLGHVFPVWLGFKGGKGVATGLGVLLGYWPVLTIPAAIAAVVWGVVVLATRYVSLASIAAAITVPVSVLVAAHVAGRSGATSLPFMVTTGVLAGLVVVKHLSNIKRLVAGVESQIGK